MLYKISRPRGGGILLNKTEDPFLFVIIIIIITHKEIPPENESKNKLTYTLFVCVLSKLLFFDDDAAVDAADD